MRDVYSWLFEVLTSVIRKAWLISIVSCLLGMMFVGGMSMIGSMFFEQTLSQMTVMIVLQHIAIFFGGAILVATGILGLQSIK